MDVGGRTFDKLIRRPKTKLVTLHILSIKAKDLLKSIEVLKLKSYDEQTRKAISKWIEGATIGYGHLIAKTDWNKYKNGLTKVKAGTLFEKDLAPFVRKVKNKVTANITQNEFDALIIFAFNIGKTGFSGSSVLKLVNNPGAKTVYSSLKKAWMAWNKSQGKDSQGLINRRKAEWQIYTKGIYKKW